MINDEIEDVSSEYCIYYLYDSDNYLSGYVGFTSNLKQRLKRHFVDFRKNTPKTAWIKSRIENNREISVEILMNVNTKDECCFCEQFYISYYKSLGFSLKNSTWGGEGGQPSLEVRHKMSLNRKGKSTELQTAARKKSAMLFKGKKHSRGHVEKIANKLRGVKKTKEHIEKVIQTKRKLNLFATERCSMFGKKHSEITKEKIRQKAIGRKLSPKTRKALSDASARKRKVVVYNSDGSLNGYFNSLTEAAKENLVGKANLSSCLRNKQKTFKNGKTIKYVN